MRSATSRRLRGAVLCAALTAGLAVPGPIEARVVRIEIERVESPAFGGPDLCDAAGQQIDFAATRTERLASGDPRPSLEERYPVPGAYVQAVSAAARDLARGRLLLDEDVERIVADAETAAGR